MEVPTLGETLQCKGKTDTSELNLHQVLNSASSNGKQSYIQTVKLNSSPEQGQHLHFNYCSIRKKKIKFWKFVYTQKLLLIVTEI